MLIDPVVRLHNARVVKLVDTSDLKSAAYLKRGVPVRFRPRAPVSQATPKFDHKPSPFIGNWVFYCLQMAYLEKDLFPWFGRLPIAEIPM